MARPNKPVEVKLREGKHAPTQPTLLGGRVSAEDLAKMKPPAHLSAAEKSAWQEIIEPLVSGGIVDRADLRVVEMAARALTRARMAGAAIAKEGLFATNSQGRVAHPAIAIEKGAMAEYRQLAVLLGESPSGRAKIGKPTGAKPDGGMSGELARNLPAPARLRVVNGDGDGE